MIRILLLSIVLILSFQATGSSETMYVTDSFETTVRAGRDSSQKVIAMLKSNDAVEVAQTIGDWCYVRIHDGREGWTPTQSLTTEKPKTIIIENLKSQNLDLNHSVELLKEENLRLQEENKQLNVKLAGGMDAAGISAVNEQDLKHAVAEVSTLKEAQEKLRLEVESKTAQVGDLEKKINNNASWMSGLKWFLGGAATLIVGIIFGTFFKKERRPSLL
ncbi:MAG: TIGR04211 family SH3 domain-containing protein [Pseudomonadota bacterium]